MSQFLFKNKWLVLAFAVVVLAGVQALVGRSGALSGTPHGAEHDAPVSDDTGSPVPGVVIVPASADPDDSEPSADDASQSYVDDDELIDNADGYDPSPADDQQADDNGGSHDDDSDDGSSDSGDD